MFSAPSVLASSSAPSALTSTSLTVKIPSITTESASTGAPLGSRFQIFTTLPSVSPRNPQVPV